MFSLRNLETCFLYSQYLLNGPNAYEYERMICKGIRALWCLHFFSVVFGPIRLILAGNVDIHTISDGFECPPDPMSEYRDITRSRNNDMGPD